MRSSTVIALFAGSVAAQSSSSDAAATGSSAVVLNPLMPAPTMTVIGSSAGTVTYVSSCTGGGIPASWLSARRLFIESSGSTASSLSSNARSAAGTLVMTPISAPATTAAARLRRQEDEGGLFGGFCEPITIKQGSTAAELHLEDPTKGVWTADMNCNWTGDLTTADLTCTATHSGSFAELNEMAGVMSNTIKGSDAAEASVIATISVVQPASNSATPTNPTASGSQSGSANSTASGSGAPASTGAAAGSPLSVGVMAVVGGAAGVFAAALAL
ncbi:hypothetical protein SVAN01_06690 [Stagonosporopsis vannaccii]|nr:hypothetical protein SVAN01_06690 [Stagonosporopsis vannaccii]